MYECTVMVKISRLSRRKQPAFASARTKRGDVDAMSVCIARDVSVDVDDDDDYARGRTCRGR